MRCVSEDAVVLLSHALPLSGSGRNCSISNCFPRSPAPPAIHTHTHPHTLCLITAHHWQSLVRDFPHKTASGKSRCLSLIAKGSDMQLLHIVHHHKIRCSSITLWYEGSCVVFKGTVCVTDDLNTTCVYLNQWHNYLSIRVHTHTRKNNERINLWFTWFVCFWLFIFMFLLWVMWVA